MNKKQLCIILGLLLPGAALADVSGQVIKVLDGDTVDILTSKTCNQATYEPAGGSKCRNGNEQIRVRLAEIDAPESKQPYGKKAKEELSALVFSRHVEVKDETRDRYGRYVGQVYVDNEWVNAFLVSAGAAHVYRQYSKTPLLLTLEKQAREDRIGLWSLPEKERVAPWEFRKNNR